MAANPQTRNHLCISGTIYQQQQPFLPSIHHAS
jgi:hypothetical protein